MKDYVLKSNFKDDINNFLNLKHSSGYKYTTGQILIEQFDSLCFSKYPKETVLTKVLILIFKYTKIPQYYQDKITCK